MQARVLIVRQFVVAVIAAAVMVGCASSPYAVSFLGKASVRGIHGNVNYATNGIFKPLKVSTRLEAGTTIQSGLDSAAYLQVNGFNSTIKVAENSTVELTRMDVHGPVTETVLSG